MDATATRSPELSFARCEHAALLTERISADDPRPISATRDIVTEWQRSAYLSDRVFALRLRHIGASDASFARLVRGSAFQVPREAVEWADELAAVVSTPGPARHRQVTTRLYGRAYERMMFDGLLLPFLSYYEDVLRARIRVDPLTGGAWDSLAENLVQDLTMISHRTLILELNVASAKGKLVGATPEDRYEDFNSRLLRSPGYLSALFSEYPVLGRAMVRAARNWVGSSAELLGRFAADVPILRDEGLLGPETPRVTAIRAGLGDPHQGGRSVARVECADGRRLFYKPRSVEPERVYHETVSRLSELAPDIDLYAMKVVSRPGYGWCEELAYDACAGRAAVSRFYRRIGSALGALLFLGAVDVHLENLLAVGEQPVPIDLETIFQHTSVTNLSSEKANERAFDLLAQSVLAPLILPIRALGDGFEESVDISAIGGGAVRSVSRTVPSLVSPYADVMRIEAAPMTTGPSTNRPFLRDGGEVLPGDDADEVISGFLTAYDTITANKPAFAGILRGSADVEVRFIARPTRRYSLFLREMYHPDYLRDALAAERLLEKLWTVVETRLDLAPVVEEEKRQLTRGDIPSFHATPGSTLLRSGPRTVAGGFFGEPCADTLERKLALFGPEHRATQLGIIEDALAALPRSAAPAGPAVWTQAPAAPGPAGLRELTGEILRHMADDALYGTDDCTWIGINLDGIRDESIEFRPMTTSLYDGLAGMSFLFAHAAAVFEYDGYHDLAERAATPVVEELRDGARNGVSKNVGAYNGMAGALYTFDHLATALRSGTYADLVHEHAGYLLAGAKDEVTHDVVSGLAGCAVVAGDLHARYGDGELRDAVAVCAERLAASAVPVGDTVAWRAEPDAPLLGGFSHGTAGIGWALLHAAATLDDRDVRELGLRALAYDQSLYVPGDRGWRDLRTWRDRTGLNDTYPVLWCHGATGIGISRLLAHALVPDAGFDAQAVDALAAVRARGLLGNQCLCHGDFGSLELFALAARILPGGPWEARYREMAATRTAALRTHGFGFGRIIGKNVFGLMMGKAGVALSLLRWLDPAVPSVLWLDPAPEGKR